MPGIAPPEEKGKQQRQTFPLLTPCSLLDLLGPSSWSTGTSVPLPWAHAHQNFPRESSPEPAKCPGSTCSHQVPLHELEMESATSSVSLPKGWARMQATQVTWSCLLFSSRLEH